MLGLAFEDQIQTAARNLWLIATTLVVFGVLLGVAERVGRQKVHLDAMTVGQGLTLGLAQAMALIPGVSRAGATISAGLLRGLDSVSATRFSFFLSIPAMIAAGVFEAASEGSAVSRTVGWAATGTGTLVAFVVGYAAIAWLLRLVARHPITVFVPYRIALGPLLAAALVTGLITP